MCDSAKLSALMIRIGDLNGEQIAKQPLQLINKPKSFMKAKIDAFIKQVAEYNDPAAQECSERWGKLLNDYLDSLPDDIHMPSEYALDKRAWEDNVNEALESHRLYMLALHFKHKIYYQYLKMKFRDDVKQRFYTTDGSFRPHITGKQQEILRGFNNLPDYPGMRIPIECFAPEWFPIEEHNKLLDLINNPPNACLYTN
jgi:hypothetical protein